MTFEQFGIGLLCVSQAAMWWRQEYLARTHSVLHNNTVGRIINSARGAHISDAADSIEMKIDGVVNRIEGLVPLVVAAVQRKTRSDAGKPRTPKPSGDPIGPVST